MCSLVCLTLSQCFLHHSNMDLNVDLYCIQRYTHRFLPVLPVICVRTLGSCHFVSLSGREPEMQSSSVRASFPEER